MATPVRINEDNYADLQNEADTQRRSVVAQLNVILDARYGRSTVGNTPPVKKYEAKTLETLGKGKLLGVDAEKSPNPIYQMEGGSVHHVDVDDLIKNNFGATPLPEPVIPNPMPDAMDILATQGEQPCCEHPTRPCKHWVWDADRGEGYKNVLSGRFREAD